MNHAFEGVTLEWMGTVRSWSSALVFVVAVACGGRTEVLAPSNTTDAGGDAGRAGGDSPNAGTLSVAGWSGGGQQNSAASGGTDASRAGAAGIESVGGTVGNAGNPSIGGSGFAGALMSAAPLVDILPLFSGNSQCQACAKKQCPAALGCANGSTCFEQMQCVIDDCWQSAPHDTNNFEGDVGACVAMYATCRSDLSGCGLSNQCGQDQLSTFERGLAAIDCLEVRCYPSCQR